MIKEQGLKKAGILVSILISGLCWYYANHLEGNFGYLMWFAPVGVILTALYSSGKISFFVAFIAYLIGRMSWFSYLISVATIIPAIIFFVLLSLMFAITVILSRKVIIKTHSWYTVFAFPVFFTAFEWLLIKFSPDGTAGSIAYSQSNFIPFIQITSLTGILGLTFLVTFIPSVLALSWHFRMERKNLQPLLIVGFIVPIVVLLFGFIRIQHVQSNESMKVGLVVLDENTHKMGKLNFAAELQHTRNYAKEIDKLASNGAKLVIIPERSININAETDSASIAILSSCARKNRIAIVAGYTNFKNKAVHNSALAINDQGIVVMDYNKVHLVNGLENQFVPGTQPGLFKLNHHSLGTAICKDLDFPEYIRQYAANNITFLCIPAWDFVVDDWLHSRMAIMRGVENGFPEVRTARIGRLTISDAYGRITAEANSSHGKTTSLVGQIPLNRIDTFYSEYGDWFGWLMIISAIYFLSIILFYKIKSK